MTLRIGIFLAPLLVLSCTDPKAPPTGSTMPTDEELLAAVPGGHLVSWTRTAENQALPEFLNGTGFRFAFGVDKPREGEKPNPDGGQPTYAWGLWHSFYTDGWVRPSAGNPEMPSIHIPSRDRWTKAAARGEYRDGKRVGSWTFWHKNGTKKAEGELRDDQMHGPWQFWDNAGNVDAEHTGTYENGAKVQ